MPRSWPPLLPLLAFVVVGMIASAFYAQHLEETEEQADEKARADRVRAEQEEYRSHVGIAVRAAGGRALGNRDDIVIVIDICDQVRADFESGVGRPPAGVKVTCVDASDTVHWRMSGP